MIKHLISLGCAAVFLSACSIRGTSVEKPEEKSGERPIQDSRVAGRAVDIQGLVSVRSINETRWRPLTDRQLIEPGDWVRCDNRGPNAVRIALASGGEVILGPGGVMECASGSQLSVISGELDVTPNPDKPLIISGGEAPKSFNGPAIVRVADRGLTMLEHEPSWLRGFKGTVVNESMGSLLVKVDGRDVPLTVGYHKVTIDIRDQIARTVIEESFVNHTNSRLEGIFHFPLPADASISEFGMWIGDELVRADVVEKQRAREIYETILREKRDPGLLEWAGGNMFKARVFPIFAHSEKRVTITYTQVLPMRDGVYRYTYPLQSDMLRQNPLRELQLAATINSTAPLKSVECTSHHTRQRLTRHAASLEFTAREYTPRRDFEIAITPKPQKSPITMAAHERGEDGYFLMLLNAGGAEREAPGTKHEAASTSPLKLVFLADTSGSMDQGQREKQAVFLKTMLSSLSEDDRFALLACDVDCVALTDGMAAPDFADTALDKLARRDSLGWTNLDTAVTAAVKAAPANAHIIYIGDGIQATSDIDPVAAARRLKSLVSQKTQTPKDPKTGNKSAIQNPQSEIFIHAVATGSAYEAVIMKALASAGGSFREMRGDRAPITAAAELLHELTHPGLRDLSVEFRGVRTTCVYPPELPNLAAGMQQIITGRYLPTSASGTGTVVVRGMQGDKPVEFTAEIALPQSTSNQEPGTRNPEQANAAGNSFIPRLWARRHLDVLLEQGASPAIREQIVGFSQEFKIMTPYTSFLVLESDEDRERFGVKRHFKMRGGEAFFTEGKDAAKYELTRRQMLAAANWRMNVRRKLLLSLKDLGREYPAPPQPMPVSGAEWGARGFHTVGGVLTLGAGSGGAYPWMDYNGGLGTPIDALRRNNLSVSDFKSGDYSRLDGFEGGEVFDDESEEMLFTDGDDDALFSKTDLDKEMVAYEPSPVVAAEMSANPMDIGYANRQSAADNEPAHSLRLGGKRNERGRLAAWGGGRDSKLRGGGFTGQEYRRMTHQAPNQTFSPDQINDDWLNQIFPNLPGPSTSQAGELPEAWPAEARDLLTGLLRRKRLDLAGHALFVNVHSEHMPAEDDKPAVGSKSMHYWTENIWLVRHADAADNLQMSWLKDGQRGVLDQTYMTARSRDAQDGDTTDGFPDLDDGGKRLLRNSPRDRVSVNRAGTTVEIAFRSEEQEYDFLVLTIDPDRQVLLEKRGCSAKGLDYKMTFGDFVEVAGVWWPASMVTTTADGSITARKKITVSAVPAQAVKKAFADFAKRRAQAVELPQPLPLPTAARRRIADGKGDIADQVSLISHAVALQKWDEVSAPEKALVRLIVDRAAKPWMRVALFIHSRRNEDARQLIERMSADIAESAKNASVQALLKPARQLVNFAHSAMQVNERLVLIDAFKSLYQSCDAFAEWRQNRIGLLQQAGQVDQALAEARQFHTDDPDHATGINLLTSLLVSNGETDEAYALLDEKTGGGSALPIHSRINLCNHWINLLQNNQSDRSEQKEVFERLLVLTESLGQANEYNYRRYLGVLFSLDPEGVYNERMNQWLDLPIDPEDEKLMGTNLAKLTAATQMALGNSYGGHTTFLASEWLPGLVRIVKTHAGSQAGMQVVNQIMSDHRFRPTEEAEDLRAMFAAELKGDIGAIDIPRLIHRTQWIRHAPPAVEKNDWTAILENLTARWEKLPVAPSAQAAQRHSLGETIVSLYQIHLGLDPAIEFSRQRLKLAVESQKADLRQKHFNLLTAGPWRKTYEDEAFALLADLCKGDDSIVAATTGIQALMLLTDWMVDGRVEAGLQEEELAGKLQDMDRQAKWQLEKQLEADARLTALNRLDGSRDALPEILLPWAGIESLDLQTRLLNAKTVPDGGIEELSAADVVAELREGLGPQAPQRFPDGSQLLLLQRHMTLAEYWAAGGRGLDKATRESLGQYLIDYCASALNLAPREPEAGEQGLTLGQDSWRQTLYDLLVILDRPRLLEKRLQQWVEFKGGDQWRMPLAYLLAATDRISRAIGEMERAESAKLLGPADYRALSGWYQVVDERGKHIAARRKALEQMPEHVLSNRIYQERNRSRRRDWRPEDGVPPEMDIDAIADHFIVLFKKSQSPANYVWQLRDIYVNTRDFRLLRCVPEGIVGMSAQQVYPMLNNLRQVLGEIRDEAVVDEFYAAIIEIRGKTVSTVDARALLLLEADVRRRASEVLNQPGQHTPKALAALQAAFDKGDWGPGENLLMADYLANLGRISQQPLAAEPRRQLKILHESAASGTLDSLRICSCRARNLSHYSRWDEAINLLVAELTAYRQASGGTFTTDMNSAMDQLAGYSEGQHQFKKAEGLLLAELERPANRNQWRWLRQRLYRTYSGAIRHQGTTGLGSGPEQYQAACKQLAEEFLGEPDYNHGTRLATIQGEIFHSASAAKIATVAADVVRFAMDYFPEMAMPGRQYIHQYHSTVGMVAQTVKDLASPKAGIAFLLAVAAKEPPGISHGYQSFWGQHAYRLAEWRRAVKDLGELEKPLLDLVRRELRRQLETGQSYRQDMYHSNHSYFWGEKADVFAAVAEEVLARHPDSGKVAFQAAHYLYEGLDRYDRAIQVLAGAYERERLDENAQSYFAQCLERQSRWPAVVPVLEHLAAWRPDALGYRTRLMGAYFGAKRPADVERCRAAADKHFRQPRFWHETVAYSLGSACRHCRLDQHAVVYLEDAIALRRRSRNDRVQNDHQISNCYYELAEAYSRLGNTRAAVDAASGAIVCWSRDLDQRRGSVSRLTAVLNQAKDLDVYMATVDAEAQKTGLENPVLRKAAGLAYDNRAEPQKAIVQYRLALEGQPDDVDTHSYQVKLLRQLSREKALPEALLAWHRAAPRDASVIKQLQQSYIDLDQPKEAERAATMLVESQPLEASAHQAMAELRQSQDSWEEAAPHWRRVAELRELEPTGLLGLANAQTRLKQTDAAKETVDKLLAKSWPERFGNVHDQARALLR